MNERIKELKSQCWDERPYGPPWFNSDKFAELIVRECAVELMKFGNSYSECESDAEYMAGI